MRIKSKPPVTDVQIQLDTEKRKVDFDSFDITVKELVGMITEELIDVAPDYQRHFRWDVERESSLVESVFLGIPVPNLFMAADADGTWELIDGVQRLSSLVHFVGDVEQLSVIGKENSLRLEGMDKLSLFNGKTFFELPQSIQIQFLLKRLKITTISDKSDYKVRFDLFERLNTGGVQLTDQEIRACIHQGPFNDLLRDLAKDPNFRKVVILPHESEMNATREEFVLRFFAYLYSYKDFDHSVVQFLNEYMASATKRFDFVKNSQLFTTVFEQLARILPNGIQRGIKKSPANLYEGIAVGAALAVEESGKIEANGIKDWINSPQLRKFTTGATNSRPMVSGRIEYCRDKFLGL